MDDFGKDSSNQQASGVASSSSPTSPDGYFYGYSYGGDGRNSNKLHPYDSRTATSEEMQPLKDPDRDPELDAPPGIMLKSISSPSGDKGYNNNHKDSLSSANGTYQKTTKDRKKCEDFDEILDMVGSEGKFQKILLYAVLCPIVTVSPFLVLNTVFMWDVPDHYCRVPGMEADMDLEVWKNRTLPWFVMIKQTCQAKGLQKHIWKSGWMNIFLTGRRVQIA